MAVLYARAKAILGKNERYSLRTSTLLLHCTCVYIDLIQCCHLIADYLSNRPDSLPGCHIEWQKRVLTCSVVPNISAFPFVCIRAGDVSTSCGKEMRTMMLRVEDIEFSRVRVILSLYLIIYFHTKCVLTVLHSVLLAGYWKSAYSADPILGGKFWRESGRAQRNQTTGKLKSWM